MSRMAGIGTSPSDLREADVEPVYLLTRRRRSSIPPAPAPAPSVPPEDSVVRVARRRERDGAIESWTSLESTPPAPEARDSAWPPPVEKRPIVASGQAWLDPDVAGDDDLDLDETSVRRTTRRSRAIRVLGSMAVLGALVGGGYVVQQPKVRREALSFVTMGHEETASRVGRQIAAVVARWRGR